MMEKFVATENDNQKRLDVFLSENTTLSRSQIKLLNDQNKVFLNGKNVKAGGKIKQGDIIEIEPEQKPQTDLVAQNIGLDIVYEDQNLAVINKPQGMVVHPAAGNHEGTLVNALLFHFDTLSDSQDVRPGIVHRLDKNTSGLILVAKNNLAHEFLAKQIKDKVASRHYLALVGGNVKNDHGTIETGFGRDKKNRKKMAVYPLGQFKKAVTHYNVVKRFDGFCLVEFVLETGRTHQIRVHSAHIGHPIVGDDVYGGNCKLYSGGQLLHAYKIEFFAPNKTNKLSFEVGLPDYFEKVISKLKQIC
jgi:23S rRNA pseudouridine1911/1915/1917 synthase